MKLIINADDYGWDQDTNLAILQLCREEKLHGVSIMANWVDKSALQKLILFQPLVRLGVHIVLNEGKPVSDPRLIPSLVNRRGFFFTSCQLWVRYMLGLVDREHIQREVIAQMDFLREEGVQLFHADSHQHIHQFPFLGRAILSVLKEERIRSVRNAMPLERNDLRRKVLAWFCRFTQQNLNVFAYNDLLITYLASNPRLEKEALQAQIEQLKAKSIDQVELMCHPALADKEGCYLRRRQEFEFLRSLENIKNPWEVRWEAILQTR